MRAALDKNNRCVHISKAIRSEAYYCPLCHCPMQVRFKNGVGYYDIAPGAAHTAGKCKVPRCRFSDLWMTSAEELKRHLLYRTDNTRSKPADNKGNGENTDNLLQSVYREKYYSVVPFRFLSDFRKEGIYTWPADTVLNGYRLTDLFVSRKNADILMRDNDPLGFRIVDVKFSRLIGPDTLRFALYSTSSGKKIRFFDLRFEDQEEYEIMRSLPIGIPVITSPRYGIARTVRLPKMENGKLLEFRVQYLRMQTSCTAIVLETVPYSIHR